MAAATSRLITALPRASHGSGEALRESTHRYVLAWRTQAMKSVSTYLMPLKRYEGEASQQICNFIQVFITWNSGRGSSTLGLADC